MADCIIYGNGSTGGGGGGSDVKVMTYTGDGTIPKVLTFDSTPTEIITAQGLSSGGFNYYWTNLNWGDTKWISFARSSSMTMTNQCTVSSSNTSMSLNASDAASCMNANGITYVVYYR